MSNNKIFYCLVAGFTLGIFLSSFIKLGFSFFLFLLLLSVVIAIYGRWLATEKKFIFYLVLGLLSLALGILRYEIKDIKNDRAVWNSFLNDQVVVTGIVEGEPDIRAESVRLIVEAENILTADTETPLAGKVLVSTSLFPTFTYGDRVKINGKLTKPENFASEAGTDFDYVNYLAKDEIFYLISFAQVEIISSGHGSAFKAKIFKVKNVFVRKINTLIREPESALLNGLLLGAKNSLGEELQEDFRKTGMSHIVALSGYNVTIVAQGIMIVLAFLPRLTSLTFGALGIFVFAVMTGGDATIVRASIMAILVLVAKATGRTYDVTRALLLALIFMLIMNPKIFVFDISFQLSFLSTLALIFVLPLLDVKIKFYLTKYFPVDLQKSKTWELVLATLATQIFVLPFIFYKMGQISLVALPVNLLVLPFIPVIMLLGFIAGVIGLVSPVLALPFSLSATGILTYVLKVITFFADLPFSSFNVKGFPLVWVGLLYLIYLYLILRSKIFLRRPTSLD